MTRWTLPVCAAALGMMIAPALGAAEAVKPNGTQRVYGPAPPAPRVYGPQAPSAGSNRPATPSAAKGPAPVTSKVAASKESTRPASRTENGAGGEQSTPLKSASVGAGPADVKTRPITIYFVQGEERQSIVEFALPIAAGPTAGSTLQRAMTFEANNIEADVDGKLLLRGDVRIRFANGLRLGGQLVAVTTRRDEGPVEIVVKE
jgi:hypothetical protein